MSFFFDVWTCQGFILASDLKLIVNDGTKYAHKIARPGSSSTVNNCAIAVCGDYPENCLNYFTGASLAKDTLRELAEHFALKWVERYAGTEDYSAVHLVGFERVPGSDMVIPQMWYWSNWDGRAYQSKEMLERELGTFAEPIPNNNHIPYKVKELTGRFPGPTLEAEYYLVMDFLKQHQPYFTWNGDTTFWRSAAGAVEAALNLLIGGRESTWTIEEISEVTGICLEFLVRLGKFLPESTVSLSREDDLDVLWVTSEGTEWKSRARIDE